MNDVSASASSDMLDTLLTVSGLILASISALVALGAAGQVRPPSPPFALHVAGRAAFLVLTLLAAGALAAWMDLYVGGSVRPVAEFIGATSLLIGILAIPAFAGYILMSARD